MNNHTNKATNPLKVITGPDTRWSFANVWEPKSINGGTPKYSVSLIVPKSDVKTLAKIKAAIEAAYHEGEAKLKPEPFPVYLIIVALSTHTSRRPRRMKIGGMTDSISIRFTRVSSKDFFPMSGMMRPIMILARASNRNTL